MRFIKLPPKFIQVLPATIFGRIAGDSSSSLLHALE